MTGFIIFWALCSLFWLGIAIAYLPVLFVFSPWDEILGAIIGFIFLIILGPIAIVISLITLITVWILASTERFFDWLFGVNEHKEHDKDS